MITKHTSNTLFWIATIAFILISIGSLFICAVGIFIQLGILDIFNETIIDASSDNPGGGWLVLGGLFLTLIGGLIAIIVEGIGIVCTITNVIIYIPAIIAYILSNGKKNHQVAYWVLTALWGFFSLEFISIIAMFLIKGLIA